MNNYHETRVLFFGTPTFVVPVLQSLLDADFTIVGIVTQPDKPAKRSKQPQPSPVKLYGIEQNIPVFTYSKLDAVAARELAQLQPTVAVVAAYGLIMPKEILNIPEHGCINIHPSLLPKYRGATPLREALMQGDTEIGISIMLMDEKMDHGPILAQDKLRLAGTETVQDLYVTAFNKSTELLIPTIKSYVSGELKPIEQDHKKATFTRLIKKEHGNIDWNTSAIHIERLTRAYAGWPGAYTFWNNTKLEIIQARVFSKNEKNKQPGLVEKNNDSIVVHCGCGNLALERVKLAGKKELAITDFVQGAQEFFGSVLQQS